MSRSMLRQLEQIRNSGTYDDAVANVTTSLVSEPTISGTLEGDLNSIRTLMKTLKGTTNWYDGLTNYFDPTSCSGGASTKALNLENIGGNTLDSKTVIIGVTEDNSGSGYTVASGTSGQLVLVSTSYADAVDRRGLPIYASTGTYYDEGGSDNVCRVDVYDMSNGQEFQTPGGLTVFGRFHDGSDNSGSGEGTDVYVKFYTASGTYSLENNNVTSVGFVYPQRKVMSEMTEYDWQRTEFISSWEGDVELVEDISNLWSYTGATDGDDSPQSWTNTSANYVLQSDPSNLKSAIDLLNTEIGDRNYTGNYIVSGEDIADSIDKLDIQLKTVADSIGTTVEKYVEETASLVVKNTVHSLPSGATYTPDSTSGQEGSNMDVYVGGQLLAADTGSAGANADRDYAETTTSGITFRFNVQSGRNITYIIRQ